MVKVMTIHYLKSLSNESSNKKCIWEITVDLIDIPYNSGLHIGTSFILSNKWAIT